MRKPLPTFRILGAVLIALAVPLVVYVANGTMEPWSFVLGATFGIAWYVCPCSLPV